MNGRGGSSNTRRLHQIANRKATPMGGLFVSGGGVSVGALADHSLVHVARNTDAPVRPFVRRLRTVDDQNPWLVFEHPRDGLAGIAGEVSNLCNRQSGFVADGVFDGVGDGAGNWLLCRVPRR
jgi:hypothetical protein